MPDYPQPVLLLGGHSVQSENGIALRNSNTYGHNLRTEASVIVDGGDSKQLEQEEHPAPPAENTTHLVAGIGDAFSTLSVGFDSPSLKIDERTNTSELGSLGDRIREAHSPSVWWKRDQLFLPIDKRAEFINKRTIQAELESLNLGPEFDLTVITQRIWGITTFPIGTTPKRTTRRKLFTILLLMKQVGKILDLIRDEIHDSDLPFFFATSNALRQLHRKLDGEPNPIAAFESWDPHSRDQFVDYQWRVLAPFWELSSEENPLIRHYVLDENIILPFVELPTTEPNASATEYAGGFGEIRKVNIHTAHYNHQSFQHKQTFFAVKKLLRHKLPEAFDREAASLRRVGGKKHPHIIRLLVTFKLGKDHHLVFPWADENLSNYWEKVHPDGGRLHHNTDLARWMANQFMGLASGIQLIHGDSTNPSYKTLSPGEDELFGRHGDLKPDNILWFEDDGMGTLQIADFGLAEFHRKTSCNVSAIRAGRSPTHRAPECDAERLSLSSDMWSFGCIALEFVVWYLRGWDGVDEFSKRRQKEDDILLCGEDKFFINAPGEKITAGGQLSATLKSSVTQEILILHRLDKCSDFFCDVLALIQSCLLQIQPVDRKSSGEIFRRFKALHQKCIDQPAYCSSKTKKATDLNLGVKNITPVFRIDNSASTLALTGDTPRTTQNSEPPSEPSFEDDFCSTSQLYTSPCGENERNQMAIRQVSQLPDALLGSGLSAPEAKVGKTRQSTPSDPGESCGWFSFRFSFRDLASRILDLIARYLRGLCTTSEITT